MIQFPTNGVDFMRRLAHISITKRRKLEPMSGLSQQTPIAKITIQVWRPALERFDATIDRACLRRDAWLSRVLDVEVDALDAEVPYPNAEGARKLVGERLAQMERKLVSLKLPVTTLARLEATCERKRIVRDAFFNRLFLLLAAKPDTLDRLFGLEDDWERDVWTEHCNELFYDALRPLHQEINPLLALRTALDMQYDGVELADAVDAASGMRYRIVPDLLTDLDPGATDDRGSPPDSIYSRFFDLRLKDGTDLIGLNTFVSHDRLRALTAPPASRSEDLDALLQSPGEPT